MNPTVPRIVRVAIYLRQSLDAKDDRAAVLRQLKVCKRWCAERSTPDVTYQVDVRPYLEGGRLYEDNDTSATKGTRGRKGFTAMLADARGGAFDLIIAYHLDRLTRTIRDLLPLLELATVQRVGTTTVSGELDLSTDMGRLVAGILAVVAQAEVDRKSARQILANEQRADVGDPHIGGAAPVGYDRCERGRDEQHLPKIVIRPADGKLVHTAYKNVMAGRSCSAIARDLNDAGLRTTKLNTKGKGLFTHNGVKQLLTNPLYAGKKVYRGEIVGTGNWEPIVDELTWRSVKALLTNPARRTNPQPGGHRRWLGTGLYRCGRCAVDGVEQTVIASYRDGGARVYQCRDSKHLTRVADAIDTYVTDTLCARFMRDDATDLLEDHDRPDLAVLHDQEAKLVRRIEEATDAFTDDPDVSPAQLRRITASLRVQLAEVQASMEHTDRVALLGDLIRADNPREVWDAMPLDRQRTVLAAVLEVTVQRGRVGGNSRNGSRPLDESTIDIRRLV